jgi:hypothetical protein
MNVIQPRQLVERFYCEIWNKGDEQVAREIIDPTFRFRGSLGPERLGQDGFIDRIGDGFAFTQLAAVVQNRVNWQCDPGRGWRKEDEVGQRNKITSQRRRIETRLPPPAFEPVR